MPVVSVFREAFLKLLGRRYTEDEFDELCFQYGVELDDVTSEAAEKAKAAGHVFDLKKEKPENIQWKIEVPANRYDLLCVEGLARAFRVFLELEEPPRFAIHNVHEPQRLTVRGEVAQVRKFMVSATLRGIDFTKRPGSFLSFLALQEKLHMNICRKRKLVSIGTHDLDKVQGPFVYTAEKPEDIVFVPLTRNWMKEQHEKCRTEKINARQLFALLREVSDPCASYLGLVEHSEVWPVLRDARGEVLSLPPILNGQYSAMTEQTRNVLIDVTATDYTKANIVLNTMIAMFSDLCAQPFTVEQVLVTLPSGRQHLYPEVAEREHTAQLSYINSMLGLQLSGEEALRQLKRMGVRGRWDGKDSLIMSIPITRTDVMHQCDLAEDVAIAYGYDNLKKRVPFVKCFGAQQELNKFTDRVREEIARCNYLELLTEVLVSWRENYDFLLRPRDNSCVVLTAPMSADFEICRTTLMPGILKSFKVNRAAALPLRVFQVDDVVLRDANTDTGARNERHIIAAYTNKSAGLEVIHGLLDKICQVLQIKAPAAGHLPYVLREAHHPSFFPGRCVDILIAGTCVGVMGVVHPEVLHHFGLANPVSLFEINLEFFL